eukprot:g18408.t1
MVVETAGKEKSYASTAPPPVAGQDDKELAKQRLQRLIRDFAHDVVSNGLSVQVATNESEGGPEEGTLRLDRKLRQVEFWQGEGVAATIVLPFSEVESISKVDTEEGRDAQPRTTLSLFSKGDEVRVTFESTMARDRAFTCFRIFHMSASHVQARDNSR